MTESLATQLSASSYRADRRAALGLLLTSVPAALSGIAQWIIYRTYNRYHLQEGLDLYWYAVNMNLVLELSPLILVGVVCLVISGGLFISLRNHARWSSKAAYAAHWCVSAALLLQLFFLRVPFR